MLLWINLFSRGYVVDFANFEVNNNNRFYRKINQLIKLYYLYNSL